MKRTLAFLLSLMMVFSILPASALATETPVSDAAIAVEQPAEETLELLSETSNAPEVWGELTDQRMYFHNKAPAGFNNRNDNLMFTWELYFSPEEDGAYKKVDTYSCAYYEYWLESQFNWYPKGEILAEHGEGYYYVRVQGSYTSQPMVRSEWGYSETIHFTYQSDAQLEAPEVSIDSGTLSWEPPEGSNSNYVVLAVIRQGSEVLDYRTVSGGQISLSKLYKWQAGQQYNISLMGCHKTEYAAYRPSEWATVSYRHIDDTVYTRMEAARLIVDVLGLEYQEEMAEWAYSDLSVDTEDGKVAAMMAYHSIMQNGAGNFYGDFGPDEPIQRYEMAMSLNRALPLEYGSVTIPDAIPVEHPFGWAAVNVVSAGLMELDENGKFRPHDYLVEGDVDCHELAVCAAPDLVITDDCMTVTLHTFTGDTTLELYHCESEYGKATRVAHMDLSKHPENLAGRTFTWTPSGALFAEHGEGWYYIVDTNTNYKSVTLYFDYAEDANKLDTPVAEFNMDSLELSWTCDNPVLAVICRENGGEMEVDYRMPGSSPVSMDELLGENAPDGNYTIGLCAFSEDQYRQNMPSDWVSCGYQRGDVQPEQPAEALNRIGVARLLVSAFDLEYRTEMGAPFSDLDPDSWDSKDAAICNYYGVIAGKEAGRFAPTEGVTRAQLAKILSRALGIAPGARPLPSDVPADAWYLNDVGAVLNSGVMEVDSEGKFNPNAPATEDDILDEFYLMAATPMDEGECGDDLNWSLSRLSFVLTITGSGEMYDYNDAPWSAWSEQITAVSLPEGLTHLGASAFYKCKKITEIDLPDSLETIGSRALATVGEALEALHIPAKVTAIDNNALGFNSALTEITVDADNTTFCAKDGFLLTKDEKTLVACPGGFTGTVTLPDGITTIGGYACCDSSAETFILPDSLTTIEYGGFWSSGLTSIEIPTSVTGLGDEAFYRCKDLHTVTFLGNAPTLGEDVFGGCASDFCIYYDPANAGWSTPEWNGWPACPIGTDTPASKPLTEFHWDKRYPPSGNSYDENGCLAFNAEPGQKYRAVYYRVNTDGGDDIEIWSGSVRGEDCGYANASMFSNPSQNKKFITGTYYVEITPVDGNGQPAGATVKSPSWDYVNPGIEFEVSNPRWGANNTLVWDSNVTDDNIRYLDRYMVELYFNATSANANQSKRVETIRVMPDALPYTLPSEILEKNGPGWYFFQVIAETVDVKMALRSQMTDYSAALEYGVESPLSVSNPAWGSGMTLSWTDTSTQPDAVDRYYVQFLYNPTEDNAANAQPVSYYNYYARKAPHIIPDSALTNGNGWYYFRVQAISNSNTVASSAWSPLSAGYRYTVPSKSLDTLGISWMDDVTGEWRFPDEDQHLVKEFEVIFYFSPTESDDLADYKQVYRNYPAASHRAHTISAAKLADCGDGWYCFAVRAITNDPTAATSGRWNTSTPYHYTSNLPAAQQATQLNWHDGYRWGDQPYSQAGLMSFKGYVDTSYSGYTDYRIELFREEATGNVSLGTVDTTQWRDQTYVTVDAFAFFADKMTSGTYFFTVTTRGFAGHTKDSVPVSSGKWVYDRPGSELEVYGNTINPSLSVDWVFDGDLNMLQEYEVEFSFCKFNELPYHDNIWGSNYQEGSMPLYVPSDMLEDYGNGYYYFRIRTISRDPERAVPSEWTPWSTPVAYYEPTTSFEVSNPVWNGETPEWTDNYLPGAPVLFWQIRYYYGKTADSINYDQCVWDTTYGILPAQIPDEMIAKHGEGYYTFKVNMVSADLSDVRSSGWSEASEAKFIAGLPKLGTPTDLKWHVAYEQSWENDKCVSETPFQRMGAISFTRPLDEDGEFFDQGHFEIHIYNADTGKVVHQSSRGIGSTSTETFVVDTCFIYGDLPSGTYYFKVRCRADEGNYASGDWVDSRDFGAQGVFSYEQPTKRLSVPTGLCWDDYSFINWETQKPDIVSLWSHVDNAAYYFSEHYWAEDETSGFERLSGSFDIRDEANWLPSDSLRDHDIAEYGEGLYYFRVQAVPADITQYRISEWSAFSTPYDLDLTVDKVNDQLDDVKTNASSAADIQQAVAQIKHLDKAMAADAETGSTDTLAKLADLEKQVKQELGINTAVAVDTSVQNKIDASKVSASNMALNVDTATAQNATVTLNITTADVTNQQLPKELIDTQKANTVVFSMDIDGAKDADGNTDNGKQLQIPVQITLPIPKDINRAFLVILHQKSDGDWEELTLPHVYEKNGQWYATFNVYSFSNYAIGEKTLAAKAEGNTVTLNAHLPTHGVKTQYLCVVYSEGGQMLGMGFLQPQSDEALVITLAQDVPENATVRIFAPDVGNGWKVHSAPASVTIVK